jgi:phosphoserine phosphatase
VRARYPVVVFDLDGTLLRTTTVSQYLADWMGHTDAIADLESRFRAHEISNRVVADASAAWFEGREPDRVWAELERAPWIEGIEETVGALAAAGARILLGTVTWRFAAEMLQRRYGFDAVCGTEMQVGDGLLSGRVSRYFDEHDKVRFVEDWSAEHGFGMDEVAAVGDSRSDVPLFERAGLSIALNATEDARAVADRAVDSEDLRDVLPLLIGEDAER